jgi:hypothetical protein
VLTTHPHLVPRYTERSRAIPLLSPKRPSRPYWDVTFTLLHFICTFDIMEKIVILELITFSFVCVLKPCCNAKRALLSENSNFPLVYGIRFRKNFRRIYVNRRGTLNSITCIKCYVLYSKLFHM